MDLSMAPENLMDPPTQTESCQLLQFLSATSHVTTISPNCHHKIIMLARNFARKHRIVNRVCSAAKIHVSKDFPMLNGFSKNNQETGNWIFHGLAGLSLLLSIGVAATECSSPIKTEANNEEGWRVISRKEVETHNAMEKGV